MKYRYILNRADYTDYASGKIFYSAPGHPAFPVRLASEIFQRCLALWRQLGAVGPCTLYDPCCGGAYLLGVIAYLNWENIDQIIGSDIDERALSIASCNLALLSLDGLDQRIAEISEMANTYGKPSHAESLSSGQTLRQRLLALLQMHPIKTSLFCADATGQVALLENLGVARIDIVITDTPYGQHSTWQFDQAGQKGWTNPILPMLEALHPVLAFQAVVAVIAEKKSEIHHAGYEQVSKLKLGKRQVVFLRPTPTG